MGNEKESIQRNADIHTLALIDERISSIPRMHFVLTGSYSVEALTEIRREHNDMDGNIFATNLVQVGARVPKLIEKLDPIRVRTELIKKTSNRLEFEVRPLNQEQSSPGRLEFRLIETLDVPPKSSSIFYLENSTGEPFEVPVISAPLEDSHGQNFLFRVKSLPYAIATWAIRLSGLLQNQKRPIKNTDLDNFVLMLAKGYDYKDVVLTMRHHPQMLKRVSEKEIFRQALIAIENHTQ